MNGFYNAAARKSFGRKVKVVIPLRMNGFYNKKSIFTIISIVKLSYRSE